MFCELCHVNLGSFTLENGARLSIRCPCGARYDVTAQRVRRIKADIGASNDAVLSAIVNDTSITYAQKADKLREFSRYLDNVRVSLDAKYTAMKNAEYSDIASLAFRACSEAKRLDTLALNSVCPTSGMNKSVKEIAVNALCLPLGIDVTLSLGEKITRLQAMGIRV